jgi:hypothetical protein
MKERHSSIVDRLIALVLAPPPRRANRLAAAVVVAGIGLLVQPWWFPVMASIIEHTVGDKLMPEYHPIVGSSLVVVGFVFYLFFYRLESKRIVGTARGGGRGGSAVVEGGDGEAYGGSGGSGGGRFGPGGDGGDARVVGGSGKAVGGDGGKGRRA